jgi:hypothetical protein
MTVDKMNQLFVAAVLLGGSQKRAERAIIDAIDVLADVGDSEQDLTELAVESVLNGQSAGGQPPNTHDVGFLPAELRRVLKLPWKIRLPFILRTLLALPRERCASVLDLDAEAVDEANWMAEVELGRLATADAAAA